MFRHTEITLALNVCLLLGTVVLVLYGLRLVFPALQAGANRLFDDLNQNARGLLGPLRGALNAFQGEWTFVLGIGFILLIAAFGFLYIAEDVIEGHPAQMADQATYLYFRSLRNPLGDNLLIAITEMGDAFVVTTLGVAVALWLMFRRAWRALACWTLAIAGGSFLNTAIKVALHRSRPTDLYHQGWSAFSFPSGHSTTNAVLYGFLAILIARGLPRSWRFPLACGAASLVTLIAFSRLYLGAHWLSDVMGGISFGSLWVALTGILYFRRSNTDIDAKRLLVLVVAVLAISSGWNIALHHSHDLYFYAMRQGSAAKGTELLLPGSLRQ